MATINSLHYFFQLGFGVEALLPTIKIVLQYLQFHAKTEEGILRENNYKDIEHFVAQAEQDVIDYKNVCREALAHKDPQYLLIFLKDWWIAHLKRHEEIRAYIK